MVCMIEIYRVCFFRAGLWSRAVKTGITGGMDVPPPSFLKQLVAFWYGVPLLWRPLVVLCTGLFLGVSLWVTGLDERLQEWLWVHYDQNVNNIMRVLGEMGKGTAQVGVVALVAAVWGGVAYTRYRAIPLRAKLFGATVGVFVLAGVMNWVLKWVVGRPRPKEILMNGGDPWMTHPFGFDATFWSFPSGHACSTWAIAMWLMFIFPRWRMPLAVTAVILSASRFLAVTPHYLGDVIAGSALGAAVAMSVFAWAKPRIPHG